MNDILLLRVLLNGNEIEHRAFSSEMVVLGRDPYADVYLEDPKVSRTHAVIKRVGQEFHFESVGANGATINGKPAEKCVLHDGDTITLGQFRVVTEVHPGTSPAYYLLSRGQGLGIDLERTLKDAPAKS